MKYRTLRYEDKQTALTEIRNKYGPDAVIVDTKMVREKPGLFGMFSKKICEIKIAFEPQDLIRQNAAKSNQNNALNAGLSALGAPGSPFEQAIRNSMQLESYAPPDYKKSGDQQRVVMPTNKNLDPIAKLVSDIEAQESRYEEARRQEQAPSPIIRQDAKQKLDSIAVKRVEMATPKNQQEELEDLVYAKLEQKRKNGKIQSTQKSDETDTARARAEQELRDRVNEQRREFTGVISSQDNDKVDPSGAVLGSSLDEIRDMLKKFSVRMEYAKYSIEGGYSPEVERLFTVLVNAGVEADIAHELASNTQRLSDSVQGNPEKTMRKVLRSALGETRKIRCEHGECNKVMLVGPTGAGKTTTLAKLAANFAIKQDYSVGIINADIYRIAATDQLNTYADIINVPCLTVEDPAQMKDALRQFEDKELVLIDTTGRVASDTEYQKLIYDFIQAGDIDQIMLTLSSTTANRILKEVIKQHEFLEDFGIIVTKTDEDISYGAFVNICKYSSRPLAYYTLGQTVPDDIRSVDCDELIRMILKGKA